MNLNMGDDAFSRSNRMRRSSVRFIASKVTAITVVSSLGCFLLSASQLAAQEDPPLSVSGPQISALIRNTVIAINQANLTGNYTVLRDLGSAGFSYGRSAATLADIFRPLRENKIDLADTVLQDPLMSEQPRLSAQGMLQLKGWFPRGRENVTFDLTYRYEDNTWRIMSVAMGVQPVTDNVASGKQNGANSLGKTQDAKKIKPASKQN